jgi:hypothetical protein
MMRFWESAYLCGVDSYGILDNSTKYWAGSLPKASDHLIKNAIFTMKIGSDKNPKYR